MTEQLPPPWEDGVYSTKRHGVTLTNCDAEPVHTPGCIQDCGALLVVRRGDLTVLQVSDNSAAWLGSPPERILGRTVAGILGEARAARLREMLGAGGLAHNPTFAFTLPASPDGPPAGLDLTVHTSDGFVMLELSPAVSAAGPDPYALVRRATARLQGTPSLRAFCEVAAEEVRRLTGFDRVMIYRFHADGHGEVFAESRRDDLSPWLGHHYPAEDIPRPAREIFQKIWVRPLSDARGALHELVPLANPDTGRPLDMTYCVLRGASVMYTEYLQNMGVAASLTMAIRVQGELWGLIACHHLSAPAPVPWPVRAACELLAQVVSLQLQAAEDREQFAYRLRIEGIHQELVARAAQEGDLASMLESAPGLLDGLDASGAALFHGDRRRDLVAPVPPDLRRARGRFRRDHRGLLRARPPGRPRPAPGRGLDHEPRASALRLRLPRDPPRRRDRLGGEPGPGRLRRGRQPARDARRRHRHHPAQARRGGPAGGGPAQGRVPGDPGARAAQPPGAAPHGPVAPRAARARAGSHEAPGDDGAAAREPRPPRRRPARRVPHQQRQGGARAGADRGAPAGRGGARDQPTPRRRRRPHPGGVPPGGSAVAGRGPGAPRAGGEQPRQQRRQVHAARGPDRGHGGGRGRPGGPPRHGQRRRHPAGDAVPGVRHVHPGRPDALPGAGGARHRPLAGPQAHRDARRAGGGRERRARAGQHVRRPAPARTGWGTEEDRRRSREAGLAHHLTKPADPRVVDELLARLTPAVEL